MDLNAYIFSLCSAVYATLSVLITIQARGKTNLLLAASCGVTAVWAAFSAAASAQFLLKGLGSFLDVVRILTWYSYLLDLYSRSKAGSSVQILGFTAVATSVFATSFVLIFDDDPPSYMLFSLPISTRLLACICELLLIENLYFNLPERARWHVALPCILLGGLACFDILVVADTVLFRRPSAPLATGRAIAMMIVAPLLVLAALRGQRWGEPIRLSRTAVFHSATLVLSGSVLLSLALVGEVLRHLDETWGWLAELSLVFSGIIGIMLFVSSRSARSLLQQTLVHHFFAERYDYRSQWLKCIRTLSATGGPDAEDLHTRSIQAVADVVNSPSGTLFVTDGVAGSMKWACSWNMPSATGLLSTHPLFDTLRDTQSVVDLTSSEIHFLDCPPFSELGSVWLAVPLLHSLEIIGVVVVGPPRMAFRVDQEVFDLLTILGREVGAYIAEQRATEIVFETRSLHDYGRRFAFVAHDIKNVASQLTLLLSNAEHHLKNPEFQLDMVETVRSSVQKIDRLLKRLDQPTKCSSSASIAVVARLESLLHPYQGAHEIQFTSQLENTFVRIMIEPEAFDAAVSHLLNNALEAAPGLPIRVLVSDEDKCVAIDIIDRGHGMAPEFIRDDLFSPLRTGRDGGSGIGAFQARALITEAGGELSVISQKGVGTTMRILLQRADTLSSTLLGSRLQRTMGN